MLRKTKKVDCMYDMGNNKADCTRKNFFVYFPLFKSDHEDTSESQILWGETTILCITNLSSLSNFVFCCICPGGIEGYPNFLKSHLL